MTKIKIDFEKKLMPLGDLYGLFFEDLNHAADGGLYAEMIQNRSFEYCKLDNSSYHSLFAWEMESGKEIVPKSLAIRVLTDDPIHPKNCHYLKINCLEKLVIRNRGYNQGLYLKKNEKYRVSFFIKPDFNSQNIIVQFQDDDGNIYDEKSIRINKKGWNKYLVEMSPYETVTDGRFTIIFPPQTHLAIDMISVFPKDTFMGRENGCRLDLVQKIKDMNPKFIRFPGGCLVHDGSLNSDDHDSMYRWKNTLGPVEKRPTKRNNWGYNQSLGLGFYEYFQLCEDIGAKPIPVIPAGWNPHHQMAVSFGNLDLWIQDSIDLIEFANGDDTSIWGGIRAEMGHPKPFGLEYLGIGNEEVGQEFFDRYSYFHKSIKERYPEIKIINSAGPFSDGSEYNRGWNSAITNQSDLIDEHYYASPEWFLANHHRYDSFDTKGPKVFLGEYASKGNKWWNALSEASYMIGLERNANKVALACYAPLFANIDYVNWRPNLIWFNQEKVFGSVNYDVQKIFSTNQGTHNISFEITEMPESITVDENPIIGGFGFEGQGANIQIEKIIVNNFEKIVENDYSNQQLKEKNMVILDDIYSKHYAISFDFIKTGGRLDKGFNLYFGYKDSQNTYCWSIGGWENQDCLINNHRNGSDSVLTQTIFKVEMNKRYSCKIEIKNREIITTINQVTMNEIENLPLVIKPAYINVVYDQEKNVYYLKIVNVNSDDFYFELDNSYQTLNVTHLVANIDAENSIEDFEKVKIYQSSSVKNKHKFKVDAYSIKFFEITK